MESEGKLVVAAQCRCIRLPDCVADAIRQPTVSYEFVYEFKQPSPFDAHQQRAQPIPTHRIRTRSDTAARCRSQWYWPDRSAAQCSAVQSARLHPSTGVALDVDVESGTGGGDPAGPSSR